MNWSIENKSLIRQKYIRRKYFVSRQEILQYIEVCCRFTTVLVNSIHLKNYSQAGNYMFKVNNRNTRTRCEICCNFVVITLRHGYSPINLISFRCLYSSLWTYFSSSSSVSIVNFEACKYRLGYNTVQLGHFWPRFSFIPHKSKIEVSCCFHGL